MNVVTLVYLIALAGFSLALSPLTEGNQEDRPSKDEKLRRSVDHVVWERFKVKHGKKYEDPTTEEERRITFLKNLDLVRKHNELYKKGEESFELELNHLSDMPYEQYKKRNGFRLPPKNSRHLRASTFLPHLSVEDLPKAVDWREKGYVTEVKNQGDCGSCYTFSATGALEGQHMAKTGKLISLSEQNLVDCSTDYGNLGCNGGLMDYAFQYIKENKGVDTEKSYPYEAVKGRCRFKNDTVGATDKGFFDLPEGDEEALMKAVATIGPIAVAIDASSFKFQLYRNGIYYNKHCSSEQLDHGVLLVGYGSKGSEDYWIVKNSWGPNWGKEGYILMARNKDNNCGIATAASYPVV